MRGRGACILFGMVVVGRTQAQGFALNEIGACAVTRAFAVTAAPCADASAVFWNPGALTRLPGLTVSAGGARIGVAAEFTRDSSGRSFESDAVVEYPPYGFVAYRVSPRLAVGAGVFVPYGLTSAWRPDFPGRFIARRATLRSIYVQPTAAFALSPDWSIGGGPVVGRSTVKLVQAIDLAAQSPVPGITFGMLGVPLRTEFARATLEGSALAYGFDIGVHGRVGVAQIGVRFLSALTFAYDDATAAFEQVDTDLTVPSDVPIPGGPSVPAGTSVDAFLAPQFTEGGPLSAQRVRTEIAHPWQLQGGVAVTAAERTTLSAEVAVMGWSSFDELRVDFSNAATPDLTLIEDYETRWTLRLGAEHRLANGWVGRAGFAFAESPAPDETVTPLLPEQDRFNYGAGLGIPLASRWTLDVGYLRVQGDGRRGRIAERDSREQTAAELNEGFYVLRANVLTIGISYASQDGAR